MKWRDAKRVQPRIGMGWMTLSDNVIVRYASGRQATGFYRPADKAWFEMGSMTPLPVGTVKEWRYLRYEKGIVRYCTDSRARLLRRVQRRIAKGR